MLTLVFIRQNEETWVTSESPVVLRGSRLTLGDDRALQIGSEWHYAAETYPLVRISGAVKVTTEREGRRRSLGRFDGLRLTGAAVYDGTPLLRFDSATNRWRHVPDGTLWDQITFNED